MTSKLDYLKKYLAQPGGDDGGKKEKKEKKKKNKVGTLGSGLILRDDSDFLPASKAEVKEQRKFEIDRLKAKRRGDVRGEFNQGKDSDEEAVFVDEKEAAKAATVKPATEETSGISWTMKMHQKKPAGTRVKPDVKEESPPRGRPPPPGPNRAPQKQAPAKLPWENGEGSDEDLSPPRAQAAGAKDMGNDSDLSPPRAGGAAVKAEDDSDLSPPRATGGGDDDLSPPRAAQKPKGRKPAAGGDDSDLSPPRASQPTIKKEEPPIKKELQSDDDLSPPRAAAPGGKKRHDSDADLSPPRKARHDSDADMSPPRTQAKKRHDSDAESDLSPPRGGKDKEEAMTSGQSSGLVRGEDLRKEAAALREKRKRDLEAMDDEQTGKDAATVYRNRDGLKVTREEWAMQQQKKKKKRLSDYPEQEIEWGGGVKQKVDVDSEKKRLAAVAAEPLARFEPTKEFEDELKETKRWADPMTKFKDQEEEAERERAKKKRPKCPHRAPPNRYGIEAGYRWDGKVRGTGYEEKWFKAKNVKEYTKAKHIADVMALPE